MEENKENNSNTMSLTDDTVTDVRAHTFMEETTVPTLGTKDEGAMVNVSDDSAIQKFFAREVEISSYSWPVGASPYFTLNPWSAYLSKTAVRSKLNQFARLRATLVVRLNISATPFHYGLAKLVYRPHPGMDSQSDYVFNSSVPQTAVDPQLCQRVVYSQLKRGVYVNPAYDTSVELRIPYMSQFPGIEVSNQQPDRIGELALVGFAPLRHAQSGTNPVRVIMLAHMEDVELDVPTHYTL